ncbi:MAG: hypothetical protein GY708_06375 [Actinomycetia bacterium]|nr:hypothetical protein [Actinomycetes bacterium]MCP4961614.1 hypothetical protein [Actinomycetes bacterium]
MQDTPGHPEIRTWAVVAVGLSAVASLAFPWHSLLGKSRSTVELMGSASALDVLSGFDKAAVIAAWLAVPLLTAVALLAAAARRSVVVGLAMLPLGPLMVGAVALVSVRVPGDVVWGAWTAMAIGLAATTSASWLVRSGLRRSAGRV